MLLTNKSSHGNIVKACTGMMRTGKIKGAAVAQSVERRIGSAEVTGPIPVSSLVKPLIVQGFFVVLHFFGKDRQISDYVL